MYSVANFFPTNSSHFFGLVRLCPVCPGCPPGFFPLHSRELATGLLNPSLLGGLDELLESLLMIFLSLTISSFYFLMISFS